VHFTKEFIQTAPLNGLPSKARNLLKIPLKSQCQWTYQCHHNDKSLCPCSKTK